MMKNEFYVILQISMSQIEQLKQLHEENTTLYENLLETERKYNSTLANRVSALQEDRLNLRDDYIKLQNKHIELQQKYLDLLDKYADMQNKYDESESESESYNGHDIIERESD